jgi:hypothetical protein
MLNWLKSKGATNALTQHTQNEVDNKNDHIKLLAAMQAIRNVAWTHAIEYRYDPTMSRAHEEYLDLANNILRDYET